ncbi:MAG: hypothetical protein K0Q73_8129 [Paenibacillus sp.]|jgi:hypothetical protein|nr:hypothetical protein [Paenibacillus sp.]
MKEVPFQVRSKEDFDLCYSSHIKVFVFNTDDMDGDPRFTGYLSDFNDDFIFVNGVPFGRDTFTVLTEDARL